MIRRPYVLVTGADGQLGRELQELAAFFHFRFFFANRNTFTLTDPQMMQKVFQENTFDYCINCAAYTAVDLAESSPEDAFSVNANGVGVLAELCRTHHVKLIHISTDYVYDETIGRPLKEEDTVNPLNVYGRSKAAGEKKALQNRDAVIIRTSWVYSAYGNNFVKTMLRLFRIKDEINVVDDQVGSPTYARDLAWVILVAIEQMERGKEITGIYNFSNRGVTSWYEFAQKIKRLTGAACKIAPISTADYPTPAQRPLYSVMNTDKISTALNIEIPLWEDSLSEMLAGLKGNTK